MMPAARLRPRQALAVGAAAGLLSGMLGVGGGLVIGPTLALLGMPLPRALGTALVAVAPIAAVAVVAGLVTAPEQVVWLTAAAIAVGGQLGRRSGPASWFRCRRPACGGCSSPSCCWRRRATCWI
ncbi:MAG: TSUP family transporter, partial [Planctomycetes bacterium]|nr:TSUP family transporter [Planctomycetota bacterium]